MLLLVIAVVALITWLTLRAAQRVSVVLGITGMNVATRVGGLITRRWPSRFWRPG